MKKKKKKVIITVISSILLIMIITIINKNLSKTYYHEDTNINNYNLYIGVNAQKPYRNKWDMNETIFPDQIRTGMSVIDYKMVYYDSFDKQFLSYLVVEWSEDTFPIEKDRLIKYSSTNYKGYFSIYDFPEEFDLLAVEADPDKGIIYALSKNTTIIYVELIFCNYYYDLEYNNIIPQEYLPLGFDATADNPYRKQMGY